MSFFGRMALLFVVVPILELMLLIRLGQVVGLLPTLGLVLFTGVAGAALARMEGMRVFFQFQRELASGRLPGQALLDGISVLLGGAFLLTPGILTDLAGLSLLFPPTRRWIQKRVRKRLEKQIAEGSIRVVTMGPTRASAAGAARPARSPTAVPGPGWTPRRGSSSSPTSPAGVSEPRDIRTAVRVQPVGRPQAPSRPRVGRSRAARRWPVSCS